MCAEDGFRKCPGAFEDLCCHLTRGPVLSFPWLICSPTCASHSRVRTRQRLASYHPFSGFRAAVTGLRLWSPRDLRLGTWPLRASVSPAVHSRPHAALGGAWPTVRSHWGPPLQALPREGRSRENSAVSPAAGSAGGLAGLEEVVWEHRVWGHGRRAGHTQTLPRQPGGWCQSAEPCFLGPPRLGPHPGRGDRPGNRGLAEAVSGEAERWLEGGWPA